jgi:hypothetical protein
MMAGVDVALVPGAPEAEAQRAKVESLLATTLQSALCVQQIGDTFSLRVVLDNVGAGHGFPSGAAQDRRFWTEVVAYKGSDVLYQSGAVKDGESIVAAKDDDLWLLRDCLFAEDGHEVHMFWEGASFDSNQLLAPVTFDRKDPRFYQRHVVQRFPRIGGRDGAPDRVTLRARLVPIGLDVLDDLVGSGDLDPAVRASSRRRRPGAGSPV